MFYCFWGMPEKVFLNYAPVEEGIARAGDEG